MERLTMEYCGSYVPKELCSIDRLGGADDCDLCCEYCKATEEGSTDCGDCAINQCFNKLGKYEDLEEQGLFPNPSLKVGNIVWDIDFGTPCSYTVTGFSFGNIGMNDYENDIPDDEILFYYRNSNGSINGRSSIREIGKTVFLTQSEAEEALKKMNMEGKTNGRIK